MSVRNRTDWSRHIDQIRRSQHYTWLGEGLAGAPPREALLEILADIRHLCRREGLSWDELVEDSATLCDREECDQMEMAG